jgi:plastocyanin
MTPIKRNGALAALLATAALGLGACGDDDEGESASAGGTTASEETAQGGSTVAIKTFMYEPSPITVAAGTQVTFTNEDDILHTVSSGTREKPTNDFDEDLDGAGSSVEVTFDQPGTIDYFCDVHQGMDGQVVVE